MSTDDQTCSPKVQREVIARYAGDRGLEIVKTYEDPGRSGLSLDGRIGLRALLEDIARGDHGFEVLLVFDVSRWGRFQDVDESAYYEFQCRKAGVSVRYCSEAFENDASPYSAVLKGLKRVMAAEFSRELSQRVYLAQRRHAAEGAFVGGKPGYARQRLLVDQSGVALFALFEGDRKSLRSDKVVIVPGPPAEVAAVREIYRLFLDAKLSYAGIAARLNTAGNLRPGGTPWLANSVRKVLTSEKYAGANVYGRATAKLKSPRRVRPREEWVVVPDAFPPIIDRATFEAAQQRLANQTRNLTDEQVLDRLRDLWKRRGHVSSEAIAADAQSPSYFAIAARFGTLNRALKLIGHPVRGRRWTAALEPNTRPMRFELLARLREDLRRAGFTLADHRSRLISVEGRINVSLFVAASRQDVDGRRFWRIAFGRHPRIDIGVLVRLTEDGRSILDAFVVPSTKVDLVRLAFLDREAAFLASFEAPLSRIGQAVCGYAAELVPS